MHQTAETIIKETGHKYQESRQPWDKTDLMILASLGVLPREDPWKIAEDPLVQYVEEPTEEDFFASGYREDPKTVGKEFNDPEVNVLWKEGATTKTFKDVSAASLNRVILSILTDENFMSEEDLNGFFLSLHSVTSSQHFLEHLLALFDLKIDDEKMVAHFKENIDAIRIPVIKLIGKWVNFHGLFIGKKTLKLIKQFFTRILDSVEESKVYGEYVTPIAESLDNLTYGSREEKDLPKEVPMIRDPQILFRPSLSLLDPDPFETARQITLLSHRVFKTVHSREFMEAIVARKCSLQTPTLREFIEFEKRVAELLLDTVVFALEKSTAFARVLEIVQHLEMLGNYYSVSCILKEFMRDEVLSLVQPTSKQSEIMKQLRAKCGDADGTYDCYAKTIIPRFMENIATIPNVMAELAHADVPDAPDFIDGMINWEKRKKMSEKTSMLYRFQNKSYLFHPVQQIQKVIERGPLHTMEKIQGKLVENWHERINQLT